MFHIVSLSKKGKSVRMKAIGKLMAAAVMVEVENKVDEEQKNIKGEENVDRMEGNSNRD